VARFLAGAGAVLVGACDIGGSLHDPAGLDVPRLLALRKEGRPLADYPGGSHGERDAVIDMPCDIWIPAARPDVLNESNVHRLRTRVVAQGANIPCTEGAERALHARGILVLPDFVVNAGGVICGSVEYHGGNEADALELIRRRIQENTAQVLEMAAREGVPPRQAALTMARAHVERAMSFGRFAGADGRHAAEGWETHTQRSDPCTASGFTAAAARG
jgi:glutamate dehydrogenase/leucine dehydrogenase